MMRSGRRRSETVLAHPERAARLRILLAGRCADALARNLPVPSQTRLVGPRLHQGWSMWLR